MQQREAVGHARDVVGGLHHAVGVVVAVGGGDVLGMDEMVVHQPADDVDGRGLWLALDAARGRRART